MLIRTATLLTDDYSKGITDSRGSDSKFSDSEVTTARLG